MDFVKHGENILLNKFRSTLVHVVDIKLPSFVSGLRNISPLQRNTTFSAAVLRSSFFGRSVSGYANFNIFISAESHLSSHVVTARGEKKITDLHNLWFL